MIFWRKKPTPPSELERMLGDMPDRFHEFLVSSSAEPVAKTHHNSDLYALDSPIEWNADQETGDFLITTARGRFRADFQAFASWDQSTNTWQWAWENVHVRDALKFDALRIKEFGQRKGMDCLTCGVTVLPADADRAKQLTMVLTGMAAKIVQCDAVFFAKTDPMVLHLGLKRIRVA